MHEPISAFLQERIDASDFPSAVYLVAEKGQIVFQDALGYAVVEPERIEATADTIYDLASLTKPLVAGLIVAMLVEAGRVDLEQIIEHYLPDLIELNGPLSEDQDALDVLVLELVSHNSAYPSWRPFYLLSMEDKGSQKQSILWTIANRVQAEWLPEVIYSDLNFLMLEGLIERSFGEPIDTVNERLIVAP